MNLQEKLIQKLSPRSDCMSRDMLSKLIHAFEMPFMVQTKGIYKDGYFEYECSVAFYPLNDQVC